jgi:hypothetical protein
MTAICGGVYEAPVCSECAKKIDEENKKQFIDDLFKDCIVRDHGITLSEWIEQVGQKLDAIAEYLYERSKVRKEDRY